MIPRTRSFGAVIAAVLLTGLAHGDSANNMVAEIYAPFGEILRTHVSEHRTDTGGLVTSFDYRSALDTPAIAERDRRQREMLAEFDPDRLETREQALAFWINAYNFFMISHILATGRENGLVESVRDYGSLFNPYRVFGRDLFEIGGRRYSLSEIENDVLLGEAFADRGWKDARVHFAVNCASVGCPPLRKQLYTAGNIDDLLDENTRLSLNTALHFRIEDDVLWLTSLFDWYEDHFANQSGSVRDFVLEHVDEPTRDRIGKTRRVRFVDYDWNLNSPENMRPWIE